MSIDDVIDRLLAAQKHGKTMEEYQDIVREERMRKLVEENEREAVMQEKIRKLQEKLAEKGLDPTIRRDAKAVVDPPAGKRRIQVKR